MDSFILIYGTGEKTTCIMHMLLLHIHFRLDNILNYSLSYCLIIKGQLMARCVLPMRDDWSGHTHTQLCCREISGLFRV